MADVYVYHTGTPTIPYDTPAKAANDVKTALDYAVANNIDNVLVDYRHSETFVGHVTWVGEADDRIVNILSVDTAASDVLREGATIGTAVTLNLLINRNVSTFGLAVQANTISFCNDYGGEYQHHKAMSWNPPAASNGRHIYIGSAISSNQDHKSVVLEDFRHNCTHVNQLITQRGANLLIKSSPNLIGTSATAIPTYCIDISGASGPTDFTIESSDLTDWGTGKTLVNFFSNGTRGLITNCKVDQAVTLATGITDIAGRDLLRLENCHSDAANNSEIAHSGGRGSVVNDTATYLTVNSESTKLDCSAAAAPPKFGAPLWSPWIYVYVGASGSTTFDIETLYDSVTALTDTELFAELEYPADVNSGRSAIAEDRAANPHQAGTARTDTANDAAWTEALTNPMTNKLSITATLGQAGWCRMRVGLVANATAETVYVDRDVTVT